MPGTDVVIRTAAEKWEERQEALESVSSICCDILTVLLCLIGATLAFAAIASVGGIWFYFYALSPSIIHTQIDTCYDAQVGGCFVRNISYALVERPKKCIHRFSYKFTVGESPKEFVFVDDELVPSTEKCTAEFGLLPPRVSQGNTTCFRSKLICSDRDLPCAEPTTPCYVLFIEEEDPLDFLTWVTIVAAGVFSLCCFCGGCCAGWCILAAAAG